MIFEGFEPNNAVDFSSVDAYIFDEADYISEGNMWTLKIISGVLTNKTYNEESDPESYSRAIFTVELVRKHNYYLGYILLPFTCLSCLQVVILIMEPRLSDRPYLAICVVLSLAVLMTFVAEIMPITSQPVLLSILMASQFAFGVVVTFYALVTCTLANHDHYSELKIQLSQKIELSMIRLADLIAALFFTVLTTIVNLIIYSRMM